MKWKQFLKAAHPEEMAIEESSKNIIFRSHRWIGLRSGYVFYQLGMSANFVSIGRMLISIISFYFISLAINFFKSKKRRSKASGGLSAIA